MDTASPLRFAPLDAGVTPLERLRSDNEAALQRALMATVGERECTLVLPHRLTTLLTHVFPRGLGALGRVTECVELTDELSHVRCTTVVYMAPAQVEDVRAIATHAGLLLSVEPKERSLVLLVVGRWTHMCTEVLNHQQLADKFHIEEVDMGFVPLDSDLVTLGRERCLYDCLVHGNKSVLVDVAASLQQLQRLYGQFEQIKYKGELSAFVFQQLMEMEASGASASDRPTASEGERPQTSKKSRKASSLASFSLVLLDRSVDFATAVSTPLTLEALVDEIFESRDGFATLTLSDNSESSPSPREGAPRILPLNGSDLIYQRARGLNIQAVLSVLNTEANAVKTKFDQFRATRSTATTAEIHEFVKSVPQIKSSQDSLEGLVGITEAVEMTTNSHAFRRQWQLERAIMDLHPQTDDVDVIFDEIEELIFRHASLSSVLRVICLYSVVHDGVPHEVLSQLKMRLLQTYGHELMFSFENLERVGLLRDVAAVPSLIEAAVSGSPRRASTRSSFSEITTALRAIDVDVDVFNPGSMAFVTSGYAPISCLLVEELLKRPSWEAIDDVMHRLNGPRGEVKTKRRRPAMTKRQEAIVDPKSEAAPSTKPHVMVVCLVGGVTYMEIAALRWLSQFYSTHQILIAGTSIVNGHSFMQELLERIPSTT